MCSRHSFAIINDVKCDKKLKGTDNLILFDDVNRNSFEERRKPLK
jgi:hypothetical protein